MQDYSSHFRQLITRQLPNDARILVTEGSQDLILLATWRLGNDASRPNKRSRMIRITIAQEALEDYARGSDGVRLASDARLFCWLKSQLSQFDPHHASPLGVEPPPVNWPVSTLILNG